nr:MoaD/ThiS family protein [uncultured Aquabacterium sp.]
MNAPTLTVHTDQGPLQLPAGSTLADAVERLLRAQSRSPDTVATAVNGDFVARTARATHALQHGDTVLCFAPITGG